MISLSLIIIQKFNAIDLTLIPLKRVGAIWLQSNFHIAIDYIATDNIEML